jgi:hypothetical protein
MSRSMSFAVAVVGLAVAVTGSGCTTATRVPDKDGNEVVLIECGAAVSVTVCHSRARDECPYGYATVSEDSGFNRKEIRVRCNPPPTPNDQAVK